MHKSLMHGICTEKSTTHKERKEEGEEEEEEEDEDGCARDASRDTGNNGHDGDLSRHAHRSAESKRRRLIDLTASKKTLPLEEKEKWLIQPRPPGIQIVIRRRSPLAGGLVHHVSRDVLDVVRPQLVAECRHRTLAVGHLGLNSS